MAESYKSALLKLLGYCRENNWGGIDPYDALNSRLFKALPVLDRRIPRLVLTQALKRSPVDIRRLMLIPTTQNPKALALFMASFLKLSTSEVPDRDALIEYMLGRLIELRSAETPYWCWGYSFPWQGRNLLVPRGAPNLVCTYFVANSLLDAYDQGGKAECLEMATSSAEYMLNELYWSEGEIASFSYPVPNLKSEVYNANLLAAALFTRVFKHTGEKKFLIPALKAARYAAEKQNADGGWVYGKTQSQQWIDNFHTGYNLCAFQDISRYANTDEFDSRIQKGLQFYKSHFFREDGATRYFHNKTYPIDSHCAAQALITLVAFKDLDSGNMPLAEKVFEWTMSHLWDQRGYFYYRVLRTCTIRTSYMRWTQAWMFAALTTMYCDATRSSEYESSSEAPVVRIMS